MKKPLFTAIYILSIMTAGLTIHQAIAQQRQPAVEQLTEVSIEEDRPVKNVGGVQHGFNFANNSSDETSANRPPANMATKTASKNRPYSFLGPFIFLMALPIGLWIIISKKIKTIPGFEKNDSYPNTLLFKSQITKSKSHDSADADADEDYPDSKAS